MSSLIVPAAVVEALSPEAKAELLAKLEQQERIVEKGQAAYVAAAKAVATIINERLYLATHRDKTAYFSERWGMSKQTLTRMQNAALVVQTLKDQKPPRYEGHCRALYRAATTPEKQFSEERLVAVWEAAKQAPQKLTAKLIDAKAKELFPEPEKAGDAAGKTFSARVTIEMSGEDEKVLVAEWKGVAFEEVSPGVYGLELKETSPAALFRELSFWLTGWNVAEVRVRFE